MLYSLLSEYRYKIYKYINRSVQFYILLLNIYFFYNINIIRTNLTYFYIFYTLYEFSLSHRLGFVDFMGDVAKKSRYASTTNKNESLGFGKALSYY